MPATLQTLRRTLARSLDDLAVYTVASATASTIVSLKLNNNTSSASTKLFDGRWIFCEVADTTPQQRRVRPGGYAPATSATTGTLTVFPDWTATIPSSSDEVEVTSLFPMIPDVHADTDYRTLINRSLALLLLDDEIAQAVTSGATAVVPTATWLDRAQRFRVCPDHGRIDVREPSPVTGFRAQDACWRGFRFERNGDTSTLRWDSTFTANGDLTLFVQRPANTWLKAAGGSYADGTALTLDADEAAVETEEVLPVALMLVYEALAARQPGMPSDPQARAKYEHYRDIAVNLRRFDRVTFFSERPAEAPAAEPRAA